MYEILCGSEDPLRILEESELFRRRFDYYSHTPNARALLARLAATSPSTLACMHGSAWTGNGAALLGALADALVASPLPAA